MPLPTTRRSRLRCEVLEDRLTPTAGDLDPTFGTGGKEVLPLDSSFGTSAAALTADQHILIAGSNANEFKVARLTQSGALDTAFGASGQAHVTFDDFGAGTIGHASAVLVQPDGKILLIGTVSAGPSGPEKSVMGLARLNADGTPDQTFGPGGKVTVDLHLGTLADFESLNAAVLQPDGRIVAAGGAMATSPTGPGGAAVTTSELLVVRFTSDGKLDPAFDSDGVQTAAFTPTSSTHAEANAVALMPDGRIVAAGGAYAGKSSENPVAIRLTLDGQFDPSFDADGKVVVTGLAGPPEGAPAYVKTLALQSDGSILLAGPVFESNSTTGQSKAFLTRLTPAGQPDTTFHFTGFWPFSFPYSETPVIQGGSSPIFPLPVSIISNSVDALLPQADGRIIIAGEQETTNSNGYDVIRVSMDGSHRDTTFANDAQQVAFNPGGTIVSALQQIDGNIVVVATAADGAGTKTTAFRLLGDPPPLKPGTVLVGGPADGSALTLVPGPAGLQLGATATPFPGFSGSVRTAVADVTGDGVPDSVVAAGPGGGPNVIVLDGKTGAQVASFFAFESSFTGGVFVAAADLNGDGKAEVIATPDQGGGPVVAIYDGAKLAAGQAADASQLARFLGIDDPAFRGGARPAVGDVSGDGTPDLLVSAGFLGGPRVALFDGQTVAASGAPVKLVPDFFAFEDSLRNGAFVAAGDVTGDGKADLAFGGGPGGAPRVRAFDGAKVLAAGAFSSLDAIASAAQVANFFAGDTSSRGGVRLAMRDADGDGKADLITGSGEGEPAQVRVYKRATLLASATPTADQALDPFGGAVLADGVFVG